MPILYRAKKQAEAAPSVGSETDYHFINKFGVSPVPQQLVDVISEHYVEEERRRENDIVVIEQKLSVAMNALAATLNITPVEDGGAASEGAASEASSQSGRIPQL